MMVSPTQLSVLRMIPVARRIARAGRHLATYRLLNSVRGWDQKFTPVRDVTWALKQVRSQLGDVPVALVGHSLGGRAAVMAGDRPGVEAVVALNPWLYPTDDNDLSGRRVLFVHGDRDRIASLAHARRVAERLERRTPVAFHVVPGGKHAMLSQGSVFEQAAADFVVSALPG
jgi:pimeloyl-ACP methyl ester carboxylesterase